VDPGCLQASHPRVTCPGRQDCESALVFVCHWAQVPPGQAGRERPLRPAGQCPQAQQSSGVAHAEEQQCKGRHCNSHDCKAQHPCGPHWHASHSQARRSHRHDRYPALPPGCLVHSCVHGASSKARCCQPRLLHRQGRCQARCSLCSQGQSHGGNCHVPSHLAQFRAGRAAHDWRGQKTRVILAPTRCLRPRGPRACSLNPRSPSSDGLIPHIRASARVCGHGSPGHLASKALEKDQARSSTCAPRC